LCENYPINPSRSWCELLHKRLKLNSLFRIKVALFYFPQVTNLTAKPEHSASETADETLNRGEFGSWILCTFIM